MPWENQSGNDKNKNPWGNGGSGRGGKGPNSPWGGGGGSGDQPDLDEMLRRAQQNFKNALPGNMGSGKFFGLALLIFILLWLASGFYTIQPGVHGVIQRFGEHARTDIDEGLGYHVPWPVEKISKVNVNEIRKIPIGFVEFSDRSGSGKQDVPPESLILTSDANIVDLDLIVQWNIESAENYLFNIENPVQNIKQVAESAVREVVGQTKMFSLITQERDEAAAKAKEIMLQTLQDYGAGINITEVLIQAAEVHPEVQGAFQDVQSAKQDAIERQNQAQAYSKEIIPEARGQAKKMLQQAEGYKQSAIARAKGDADRFSAILRSYKTGEEVTRKRIYLETMEEILGQTPKTILDNSGGTGIVPYLPLDKLNQNKR